MKAKFQYQVEFSEAGLHGQLSSVGRAADS